MPGLPDHAEFVVTGNSGQFTWTPLPDQVGSYFVGFGAIDQDGGGRKLWTRFTITPPLPPNDPPAAVTDLVSVGVSSDSLKLTWTSTGADGLLGSTSGFAWVEVSTSSTLVQVLPPLPGLPVDPLSFPQVTAVVLNPGATMQVILEGQGLEPSSTYYAVVYLADELLNWSNISRSV